MTTILLVSGISLGALIIYLLARHQAKKEEEEEAKLRRKPPRGTHRRWRAVPYVRPEIPNTPRHREPDPAYIPMPIPTPDYSHEDSSYKGHGGSFGGGGASGGWSSPSTPDFGGVSSGSSSTSPSSPDFGDVSSGSSSTGGND